MGIGWCSPLKSCGCRIYIQQSGTFEIPIHLGFVWLFSSAQLHSCSAQTGIIMFSCSIADPVSSSSSSQVCCSSFTGYFLCRVMLFMVPVELKGLKWMFQPKPRCWGLGLIWFLLRWTSPWTLWSGMSQASGWGWAVDAGTWGMISSACQPCSWTASGWGSLIKACVN